MKKLDNFVLKICHKISNWTYKKFSINNYGIATILLCLAVIATTFIAYQTFNLASTDKNIVMAGARRGGSVMAGIFFVLIALSCLKYEKNIGDFMSRKYDTDDTKAVFGKIAIFLRWFLIVFYILSILIGNKWWSMLDTLILSIAFIFLSCEPPKMEIRMSKIFKD